MEPRRPQQIEQFEIIERTVTESHRPLTATEVSTFQPQSSLRTSTEQFVTTSNNGGGFEQQPNVDRRFQLTSERDVGHDASLLYTPMAAGIRQQPQPQSSSFVRELPLHQSTPERQQSITTVNQYGYDLHEVQTNEGGARVLETHGAGHLMMDRSSLDQQLQRTPPDARLLPPSILKQQQPGTAEADTSWRKSPSSESSIQRKDSYKRMQDQAEAAAAAAEEQQRQLQQRDSYYAQSSNATILSKQSKAGAAGMMDWSRSWFGGGARAGKNEAAGGDSSFARLKDSIADLSRQLREGECSPRLVVALLLLALFLLLLLFLLWLLISSLFLHRSIYTFWLYPPVCEDCQRRGGASGYRRPSTLYVNLYSPAQVHFELVGEQPFKSNSFTAIDFDTGYIAIADHALINVNGRHTSCFLMELDRVALPAMDVLVDALRNTYEEVHAQFGWQEYWQFTVEPVDGTFAHNKFRDPIEDCQNAQWYQLKHTVYTKDESCSYCYDFCLPDYAVLRRQKYEDEVSLGIRRLNCFRLYVPEWSKYQFGSSDAAGGHFAYPKQQQGALNALAHLADTGNGSGGGLISSRR